MRSVLVAALTAVAASTAAIAPASASVPAQANLDGCRHTLTGGPHHEGLLTAGPMEVRTTNLTYVLACEYRFVSPGGPVFWSYEQPNAGPVAVLVAPTPVAFTGGTPGYDAYLCTVEVTSGGRIPRGCDHVFTT